MFHLKMSLIYISLVEGENFICVNTIVPFINIYTNYQKGIYPDLSIMIIIAICLNL